MQFEIAPDPDTPEIVGDGVQYDGYRFRAECRLAGKVYGARFGVDIAFGGVVSGDVEEITADDLLGFAGIAPPRLRVVPIETHLAEKLHAYTMPRDRPNTRVKDLPDLALELLHVEAASCDRCRGEKLLFADGEQRAHPMFQKDPPWPAPVMVVAEAPNFDDSFDPAKRRLTVEPGTDPSGAFTFDLLASIGLRWDSAWRIAGRAGSGPPTRK